MEEVRIGLDAFLDADDVFRGLREDDGRALAFVLDLVKRSRSPLLRGRIIEELTDEDFTFDPPRVDPEPE